jgi:hypothetical protein
MLTCINLLLLRVVGWAGRDVAMVTCNNLLLSPVVGWAGRYGPQGRDGHRGEHDAHARARDHRPLQRRRQLPAVELPTPANRDQGQ